MHSFTPVYLGEARPWPIGLIHGVDTSFTKGVSDALQAESRPSISAGTSPMRRLTG